MFSHADLNQAAIKGIYADPSAIQIAAAVKNNQQRIRSFLERAGTRVDSNHLILELITNVGYAGEITYDNVEWACMRKLAGIGNALKLSSVGEFGQVHNGKFITGQDEIISLVARPVDPNLSFQDYTPAVYLYHEYTNLNWQLGTGKPQGVSIIEINLVALLWQYAKGVEYTYNVSGLRTTTRNRPDAALVHGYRISEYPPLGRNGTGGGERHPNPCCPCTSVTRPCSASRHQDRRSP